MRGQFQPLDSCKIATTNDDTYLRDQTGNRRFWPIEVTVAQINIKKLKKNLAQIFAEATAVYHAMREAQPHGTLPLYIADEAAKVEAEARQADRRVEGVEDTFAQEVLARYRARKSDCDQCALKDRCCPKEPKRKVTRSIYESSRDVARQLAQTKQYSISCKLRKKVEMSFAHLKRIHGLGRLRLRGPSGAHDEFILAATAQNLKNLAKLAPNQNRIEKAA